jgi:large subunit ribosomal protein L2
MPIKVYKPTSAGRRVSSVQDFSDVTKKTPEKSLVIKLPVHSGRNNTGSITVRHQGGGAKRLYRVVDFKRNNHGAEATVEAIEYDPNRGPRIALIQYPDQTKAYMIAPEGLKVGDKVLSSPEKIEAVTGARMPLRHIPVGLFVHNVELTPGKGGQLVRGAGAGAQLQVFEGNYAQLRLPSGEVRLINMDCMATVGRVGNADYQLVRYGKAGRMRHRGIRPRVKGKNMNPVDHPHGGGEGHSPIGLKGGPKTPWGKKAMGVKTRKEKRWSNAFIISRRKKRIEE